MADKDPAGDAAVVDHLAASRRLVAEHPDLQQAQREAIDALTAAIELAVQFDPAHAADHWAAYDSMVAMLVFAPAPPTGDKAN